MFSVRDHKLFEVARGLAVLSTHDKAMIGAVLVSNNRDVVSVGVNGRKSHPLQRKYNKLRFRDITCRNLMHAEIEALIKGRDYISNSSIYVYRVMRNGERGMARPCVGCIAAFSDFKIKTMYYSTNEGLACEHLE